MDFIHPHRLAVAAHEVGHYLLWAAIPGARVASVRLSGRGARTEGCVAMDWEHSATDPDADRAYLLGLVGGTEAEQLWCAHTDTTAFTGDYHDRAVFQRVRRQHPPSRQWPEAQLRRDARALLTARWTEVEHLARRLARHGRL